MSWRRKPTGGLEMKGHEVGGSIHGHRALAEAQKVSDPLVIFRSARHKSLRIVLAAECSCFDQ
jgi:hypothetical protein